MSNLFTLKAIGICSKTSPSLVCWISTTPVNVLYLPVYRRGKRQKGILLESLLFSHCFLQMQSLDLVCGEEDSFRSTAAQQKILSEFSAKSHQVSPPACRRVWQRVILSSKVIILANRSFEVNQSILVYDPTMDFKCMQKSLTCPFVPGNDSTTALQMSLHTYLLYLG